MIRFSTLALFLAAGLAAAQDMPLHEILKPGETWQTHDGAMPMRPGRFAVSPKSRTIFYRGVPIPHQSKEPTCCAVVLSGSTLLVADAADRYVWAFRIEEGRTLGLGDRYCRLRVKGDERRRSNTPADAYQADPSAMTVDAANRTYVATNLGIQAFDPTGRLCGVFTAPPGRVTEMTFDGDRLFARIGDKTYVRQMLAVGAK